MALSRLLAFASSARPADMFTVPAVAITARTAADIFTVLAKFPNVYGIRPSIICLGEIAWARCHRSASPHRRPPDRASAEKEPGTESIAPNFEWNLVFGTTPGDEPQSS